MIQMKNANITAAPELLRLAEYRKRQPYGQKNKTTLWAKGKDNTEVKRKRQHYGQKQNERLTALVGKVIVEKEWLAKKLKSLGLSNRKPLVEFKLSSRLKC
jgi:hypothetical protein